jgi:hypothetical protein
LAPGSASKWDPFERAFLRSACATILGVVRFTAKPIQMLSNKVSKSNASISDVGHSRDVSSNILQFQLVLSVSVGRLIHIRRVEGLSFLRATGTTVPAVICRAAHDAGSTTVANDAYHRLTAVTESGLAIGVISAASDLPVSRITAKEPGKLHGKNRRAPLMLRRCKPVSVSRIKHFASKSGSCP